MSSSFFFFGPCPESDELSTYLGYDLRLLGLRSRARLDELIRHKIPDHQFPKAWAVWRLLDQGDESVLVLFGADPLTGIPCGGQTAFSLFGEDGEYLNTTPGPPNCRSFVSRAQPVEVEGVGSVIRVGVAVHRGSFSEAYMPSLCEPDFYHYYGLHNRRMVQVRIENRGGEIQREWYSHFSYTPERVPTRWDADHWEHKLWSEHPVELLEVLNFLGGVHPDLGDTASTSGEYEAFVSLARTLLFRESVHRRLQELMQSENDWIREPASIAGAQMTWPSQVQEWAPKAGRINIRR